MAAPKTTYTLCPDGVPYAFKLMKIKSRGMILRLSCDKIGSACDPITHVRNKGRLRKGSEGPRMRDGNGMAKVW